LNFPFSIFSFFGVGSFASICSFDRSWHIKLETNIHEFTCLLHLALEGREQAALEEHEQVPLEGHAREGKKIREENGVLESVCRIALHKRKGNPAFCATV
jgi:hypothetical protein